MYRQAFIDKVQSLPVTLGVRLGRWAIYHDIPVTLLQEATGATRQTVYNWMHGKDVTPTYRPKVERIVRCLQAAQTTQDAWRAICTEFSLRDFQTKT
jgi:hypothetical protein